MLMVLVYEAAIKGQRLRMGGRVAKMVKSNVNELKQVLSGGEVDGAVLAKRKANAATVSYIRPNLHKQ